VYKPEITSIFSILERITGIVLVFVLYFGVVLLKLEYLLVSDYWCYSLCYSLFKGSLGGICVGTLILFTVLSMVYHVVFGARYLYWDRVFSHVTIESLERTTVPMLLLVIFLTLFIWFLC
jgi:succinate dehydrogenase cytochrome b556 subunit